MVFSSVRRRAMVGVATALACALTPALAQAKKHSRTLTVCKHGCLYTTIQSAVNRSGRNATIDVRPGTYREEVLVSGHRHDGLKIVGTGKTPDAVVLQGRNARFQGNAAQDGVEGAQVDNLQLRNLKAVNYASNGFFITNARGYLMKNLVAGFNKSYGLYVYRSIGGRMTQSVGYGNGDSGFYVGGTPWQRKHAVWTTLDHLTAYENVLGYSGTNSKYITIRDSEFYNNGAGVVPNTLPSEPDQPSDTGVIEHNLIYWNNFNYYRPGSPVHTVSSGVSGAETANYPIGIGVILYGTTNWTVRDNAIFGNFLWGVGSFSDPLTKNSKAINNDNRVIDNKMGAAFNDANGSDVYNDGSGRGTCFAGNGRITYAAAGSGKFPGTPDQPTASFYPTCPHFAGTGKALGDPPQQLSVIGAVALTKNPVDQQNFWTIHSHPKRAGRTPYTGPPAKLPQRG